MTAFVLQGHMCVRASVDPFTLNSLQMEILEGLVVVDVVSGLWVQSMLIADSGLTFDLQ